MNYTFVCLLKHHLLFLKDTYQDRWKKLNKPHKICQSLCLYCVCHALFCLFVMRMWFYSIIYYKVYYEYIMSCNSVFSFYYKASQKSWFFCSDYGKSSLFGGGKYTNRTAAWIVVRTTTWTANITTTCTIGKTVVATAVTLACFVNFCHDNCLLEPWISVPDRYRGKLWEATTKHCCQSQCPIAIQHWEGET